MALWGGRFSHASNELFQKFNDSLPVDYRLFLQDIQGSIAWASAICSVGVITEDECQQLHDAMNELIGSTTYEEILASKCEDIHSFVEQKLIDKVGNLGKKLHTGRSRNDQVATDLKLWCKQEGDALYALLIKLQQTLITAAKREATTVMPGYTHMQRAQPITFGHWCLAYVAMIERDITRLKDAMVRIDTCPLGSGALAGTAYAIDRQKVATSLGFRRATENSIDSVSDRDHVIEFCSIASIGMMHLSRMAEDLIFFNTGEAGFIELDDQVTSGSSLMPQKKNPDALELIRGKTGRVYGSLMSILTTMKSLPMAYNKDMQEDKEGLFDVVDTWSICLEMASMVLKGLKVNKGQALSAAQQGYANATELADYLVTKGLAFREAHHIVGQVVLEAISKQKALEEFTLLELQKFSSVIESDVYKNLTIDAFLAKREALGGTSLKQIEDALGTLDQNAQAATEVVSQVIHITQQRLNAHKAAILNVRSAKLSDVNRITDIVNDWSKRGETLPRSKNKILRDILDFVVAEKDDVVIGCGSLYIYGTGLAELRSVAIDEQFHGLGQGRALVDFLVHKARELELRRLIVLTRVPEFFGKFGFTIIEKETLPEKVMKDCSKCLRKNACDEIAMEFIL